MTGRARLRSGLAPSTAGTQSGTPERPLSKPAHGPSPPPGPIWHPLETLTRPKLRMLLVAETREERKDVIPAVVHTDGTAGVLAVTKEQNARYHRLSRSSADSRGSPCS